MKLWGDLLVILDIIIPPFGVVGDVHSRWIVKRNVTDKSGDAMDGNDI